MPTVGNTPTATTPARKIWMRTASGPKFLITVRYGFRTKRRAGLLTARAAGFGNHTTAGHGFRQSRGAGRHITMAVGSCTAADGHGGLDRSTAASELVSIVQSGRRLTFPSSESDLVLDRLAGCRLVHVIFTIPGGADIEAALGPWVSGVSVTRIISAAAGARCMAETASQMSAMCGRTIACARASRLCQQTTLAEARFARRLQASTPCAVLAA